MKIVGNISSNEEAKLVENIIKNHVVGNRARFLAVQMKNGM